MSDIYAKADTDGQLRQGEILSDLQQLVIDLDSMPEELQVKRRIHEYAIVMTQDCDLEQDYRSRFEYKNVKLLSHAIPGILFCELYEAELVRGVILPDISDRKLPKNSRWKRIQQNGNVRYHFLQSVNPDADLLSGGLPELVIDFKRYFTIPPDELYALYQQNNTRRRTRLASPFLEHLSTRFHSYQSRVALPEPHRSEWD